MIDLERYKLADVVRICKAQIDGCSNCRFYDNKECDCTFNDRYVMDWEYGFDYSEYVRTSEMPPEEAPKEDPPEAPPEEAHNDAVSHPSHYCVGEIEVINYIRDKLSPDEFIGYCTGNVLKYVSRWRYKGGVEDLEKGVVYLNWAIEAAKKHINNWSDSAKDVD